MVGLGIANETTRKLDEMPNPTSKPTQGKLTNAPRDPAGQVKPVPTPAKPVETKTENKPVEPAFDWAKLAPVTEEPVDSKFSRGLKIDVMKEIPEPIRNDVEEAFKKDGKYVLKTCATPEQAEKFTELAKRYGKYRPTGQLTVRGGPTKLDAKVVRFNAKNVEKRKSPKEGKPNASDK